MKKAKGSVENRRQDSFKKGYVVSFCCHFAAIISLLIGYHSSSSENIGPAEVYTVTLEGGDRIGGISQVPIEDKKPKVIPNINEPEKQLPAPPTEPKVEQKIPDEASVLEEKRKAEEEKKKVEEKKIEEKKLLEKRLAEAEKKKAELEKKKKEEAEKAKEKKERDKLLEKAISKASKYTGESANAGGQGIGAARLDDKKGMGGGTIASMEFILYRNALEQHIKSGWRWLPGQEHYVAAIDFTILPDGTVQNASIGTSSGNRSFDDAALRAVYKASPVPVPPEKLYSQFRSVRLTFDSER